MTDYLADKGRTRVLKYEVPERTDAIAAVCAEILARAYGMSNGDELVMQVRES
jgi:hypothetical protein